MSTRYHFVTEIQLTASPQEVWKALEQSENWPQWWRWLLQAEVLDEGDDEGVGRRVRNRVTTPLGYRLTYVGTATCVVEPSLLEFRATGDLAGTGQLQIAETGDDTEITFNWMVETTQWWMSLLVPIARRLFAWNHNRLMNDFARGLAATTNSKLISVTNHSLSPPETGL
ncbi:MAG: SRPBCC family protein [Acidimicrobiia bacterium]